MQRKFLQQTILIMVLILSACNPKPLINELSSDTTTYDETISINNCGNKADSTQTASRSFSTKIEGTGTIKAGYDKIIEGSVSATYGQFKNITKTQTLTAAPETNMEFILRWSDDVRAGNVTVDGETANYTVNIPISVAQISSRDLGCGSFTGTWQGIDSYDNSVTTISLIQVNNELTGTYNDSFTLNVNPPGYFGEGSGTLSSPTSAQMIFDLSRWDGKTVKYELELTLSNQGNTLTIRDSEGYQAVMQKQ